MSLIQNIAVLGATGRIGLPVVRQALARGWRVTAVGRSAGPLLQLAAGLGNPPGLRSIADRVQSWETLVPIVEELDAVIDARNQRYDDWSGYPRMIEQTLRALTITRVPYLYIDNVYLYGVAGHNPVAESAPLRPVSEKGRMRMEVARMLENHAARSVVVRFPDFYGPGVGPGPLSGLHRGVVYWFGPPDLPHQWIHVEDAARAVLFLADTAGTAGRVWHVPGPAPLSGHQLRKLAEEAAGRRVRLLRVPALAIWAMGLFDRQARGFRETRYLWEFPLILDGSRFLTKFPKWRFRSHLETLREAVAFARHKTGRADGGRRR